MKKKLFCILVCLCLILSLFPVSVPAAENNPFTDVPEWEWYYDEVQYVFREGLMNGYRDGIFAPEGLTNRGMIVTILYRQEGEPEILQDNPFTDVGNGIYYEKPIIWAAENEIVNGYGSGKFAPEDPITREQMAAIIYRYADYKGYDVSARADLSAFADLNKLSSYAVDAMAWANAEGLINGLTSTKLEPQGNAVRSQVAAILYRFCTEVVPQEEEQSHIHTWDEGTVTKEATESEVGEYTCKCIDCGESVTAVLVKTDPQLNKAFEDGEPYVAVYNATMAKGEYAHIPIPEGVNFIMAGTTTIEAGAGLIPEGGNLYIDKLVMKASEKTDEGETESSIFMNFAQAVIKDAVLESGTYYGITVNEGQDVYADVSSASVSNFEILTITGEFTIGNHGNLYNEGELTITESGKVVLAEGERLECGYFTIDEESGEVTLTQEEWNEEKGDVNWYDAWSNAAFDNLGTLNVNGTLEIGEGSYTNNGNWAGDNENVVMNVNGYVIIYGSFNNVPDGSTLNIDGTLAVKENGYLGNDSVLNVNESGKILFDGNVGFDNSTIGEVVVDGTIELAEAEYLGVNAYADEWGNAWGVYDNQAWLNNGGKFIVNGEIIVGAASGLNNWENAEFVINGDITLKNGDHQECGYFSVAEDGKVEFTPGDYKEEWGGEYYDGETGKLYRYYDEWSMASFNNDGELVVNGELSASGLNNNAYIYEDENGRQVVSAHIKVTDGGTLTATGWMNNNSDWYEENDETKWASAQVLIEKGGAFNLETLAGSDGTYDECFGAYFGNSASVVIDGTMTISRISSMHNYCNERWEDTNEDGEHELISSNISELIINGDLDMTDTEVIYEEYTEPETDKLITVPVGTNAPRLVNDGYMEVSGTVTEKASNFESYGTLVIGKEGKVTFDSIWCDVDGDDIVDTYAGEDVQLGGNTTVDGEILIQKRVVCNWGEGELKINGKLSIPTTGDLYIGENAGFAVAEDAEVVNYGGRILIYDREDAEYDEDGNVVEWKGTVSRHIPEDFTGMGHVVRCVLAGSYEGLMAANAKDSGFNQCDLLEGEIVLEEDTFIRVGINIYGAAKLIVSDGVTMVINNILYNYEGNNLELQGSAKVEVVGNTTGDDADHFYWGYTDGFDISEDEEQPEGSEYAYKITIVNAE